MLHIGPSPPPARSLSLSHSLSLPSLSLSTSHPHIAHSDDQNGGQQTRNHMQISCSMHLHIDLLRGCGAIACIELPFRYNSFFFIVRPEINESITQPWAPRWSSHLRVFIEPPTHMCPYARALCASLAIWTWACVCAPVCAIRFNWFCVANGYLQQTVSPLAIHISEYSYFAMN